MLAFLFCGPYSVFSVEYQTDYNQNDSDGNARASVYANNFTDNTYCAIDLSTASTDILTYHNNFVNNTKQVDSRTSTNVWDNGYPPGGNYWSDHNGTDANHDGISDTPYVIDANNIDHYPLMKPYTLVGDINGDDKVDMRDVGYVARRFMCVPSDQLWDAAADLNGDEKINMMDIGTVARHFGEHYP